MRFSLIAFDFNVAVCASSLSIHFNEKWSQFLKYRFLFISIIIGCIQKWNKTIYILPFVYHSIQMPILISLNWYNVADLPARINGSKNLVFGTMHNTIFEWIGSQLVLPNIEWDALFLTAWNFKAFFLCRREHAGKFDCAALQV